MISPKILEKYKGVKTTLQRGQILFHEGNEAYYYYQLEEGSVKMVSYSDDGQEFIQSTFQPNDSFGEPPLLGNFPYPGTAIAMKNSTVWKMQKANFLLLLKENFDLHLQLDRILCNRLKYKSMILSEISFHDPEHRISSLLKHLKESLNATVTASSSSKFEVPFTRQQLADMSGMRVETVIRTVKKMEEGGRLELVGHKILV